MQCQKSDNHSLDSRNATMESEIGALLQLLKLKILRELQELNLEGLEVDTVVVPRLLVVQNGSESAIHSRMVARHTIRKISQLLDELLLHQDRVQVRVSRHHRLQEVSMATAIEEEETRKRQQVNSNT